MSYIFTRDCTGDLGILVLEDEREYMAAICFYRTRGDFSVFDVATGGKPLVFTTLADALNHMVAVAQALAEKGLPS